MENFTELNNRLNMEQKNNKKTVLLKRCRVCRDDAIGFNFNAVSCESCKSFFRRHAFQIESLRCSRGDNCTITKTTRIRCKRCRLKKCLDIGMKKEIIFSRNANDPKPETPKEKIQIVQIRKNATDLKGHELAYLLEVRFAVTDIHEEEKLELPIGGVAENIIDIARLDASSIKSVIKYCNNISGFKNLKQNDQLVLVNKFFAESAFLRWAFRYDMEEEGCYYRVEKENTNIKTKILVKSSMIKMATSEESFKMHQDFTHSLHREMENDPTIYDLLLTQLLFKQRENTVKHEYIRYNHIVYRYLLKRYLENKYANVDKAKEKFTKLINIVKQVVDILELFKSIYYQIVIQRVEQSDQLVDILADIQKSLHLSFAERN